MKGLTLSGDVYFDLFDADGNSTGMVGPLNCLKLAINTPTEADDRPSRMKSTFGQALDSTSVPGQTNVSAQFDSIPTEMLAMMVLGKLVGVSYDAGSVSGAAVKIPTSGRWVPLVHCNISAVSATQSDGTTPIPLAELDINAEDGLVRAAPGGALDTDTPTDILISYSYAALTKTHIQGAVQPKIRGRVMLKGMDRVSGNPVNADIPEVSWTPDEAIDFMASSYQAPSFSGNAILRDGETAPFYTDLHNR